MNELIRKLSEQAQDWADAHAPYASEEHEYFVEKFAQLIIQECADLFEVEWGDEKLTGNDVGYVVKKHFGVGS